MMTEQPAPRRERDDKLDPHDPTRELEGEPYCACGRPAECPLASIPDDEHEDECA